MNFIERVTGLITSPDKTMGDIAKEPRIEEAAVIVAIYAVFAAISAYLTSSHIKYVYTDSTVPSMTGIITIITVVMGLIMPFILWVIITAVLYLFSMVFGGEGKFMNVLSAIGYSTLPKIFAIIVSILLLTQAPVITMEISSSNPMSSLSAATDFYKNTFVMLSSLIVLVGLVWSSVLGIFGIKHTEKLSMKSAALVVGIPLVLYIVFQYGSLLLGLI